MSDAVERSCAMCGIEIEANAKITGCSIAGCPELGFAQGTGADTVPRADYEAALLAACHWGDQLDEEKGSVEEHQVLHLGRLLRVHLESVKSAIERTHPNGLWVVWYEDADVKPEVFFGEGAESAARARYEQAKAAWSCHLLSRVPSTADSSLCQGCHEALPEHRCAFCPLRSTHEPSPK